MLIVTIDKKNYNKWTEFYEDIFIKLDGKQTIDFIDMPTLLQNSNVLAEFLWYKKYEDIKFKLINFDREKIKNQKDIEDYHWNIILDVLESFVKEYPNNTIEYIN